MSDDLWTRARRVRDQLERRLGARPKVRLIDIGASTGGLPVVQVHIERPFTEEDLAIEGEIDGIAIRVVRAAGFRPE